MSDSPADGDDYLGLLTQVLNRTRMLLSAGSLGDAQSRREIARLELEVAAAQIRRQAYLRLDSSVILLPASGAVRRLTRPVVDESRRLRRTSAATRARSVELRSLRHAAAI